MKCFHFANGEKRDDEDCGTISRVSRVSWARSLSFASSTADVRRSEFGSESRDFTESLGFHEFFSQRRPNDLRVFSFSELRSATRGFSRALMIGEGGFGCVYRGIVSVSDDDPDAKMDVAIKQLNRNGLQGHKEWITELNYLGVVKHPNLVRLVGYCAEDDERGIQRLLVYELMRNKSLEDHILARMPSSLPWEIRLKIALDAARGLAYLHEEMDFQLGHLEFTLNPIEFVLVGSSTKVRRGLGLKPKVIVLEFKEKLIFRDFKSSNILLDEDFNAKLSDFGLARLGPTEGLGHVSTSVVGTVGYAAPEYIQTGRLTAKSDVWSFGVVLYELITGRRSVDRNLPRSEQKLLEWVKPYVSDSKKFHLILDPRLEEGSSCIKSAQKVASLANKCLMKQPKSRPKMSEVVEMLGQIIPEASPAPDGGLFSQSMKETEPLKEENVAENESTKQGGSYLKRVFDFREIVSFKNRSSGRLDWRNWTPGLVRTW